MLQIDKRDVEFLVTENMVEEVRKNLDITLPEVKAIVKEMSGREVERVYFVACGSPLSACKTATFLMERYSYIPCAALSGWDFVDNPPHAVDEKTAVIGVSHSGKTEEVLEALKMATERGAFTVAVTDDENNPITEVVLKAIGYHAECIWEVHLLLAYAFAIELMKDKGVQGEILAIEEGLKKLPETLQKLVVGYEQKGRQLGEKASKWDFIYTVAANPLVPLAYKEGMVTFMEFTWTHGSVIESGEFRHGPLEVVQPGVPFLFLLGTDRSRATTERAIRFVKKYTDEVIVVDYAEINDGLHPMLSPFVLFVPMEWISYYLSIYKDHNPDERRYYGGLVEY